MTHTFDRKNQLTLTLNSASGEVEITERNYPDDDATVFISRDRIEVVIKFLTDALFKFPKGGAQ